jgi:predicted Fe-S protein YdhL (DUF1289 family)
MSQVHPPAVDRRPRSPCTKICSLDRQGFCAGCLRTGEEIARWMTMTAAEQWQLVAELERRRQLAKGAAAPDR